MKDNRILDETAPERFQALHYAAMDFMRKSNGLREHREEQFSWKNV